MAEQNPFSTITDLLRAADAARAAADHGLAIEHYTAALTTLGLPVGDEAVPVFAVLADRASCLHDLGDFAAEEADLLAMASLAESLGSLSHQVEVVTRQVDLLGELGRAAEARLLADAALARVAGAGDRRLEAGCLLARGIACYRQNERGLARESCTAALTTYRILRDRRGEAHSLRWLGVIEIEVEQQSRALSYLQDALALYRAVGDRRGEANALNGLGLASSDYAWQRDYKEQALALFVALGDRGKQGLLANNLGLVYLNLGLYLRAREYAAQAVAVARDTGARSRLTLYLDTLGRAYEGLGMLGEAEACFTEGQALARTIGYGMMEAYFDLGLGRLALDRQHYALAEQRLLQATTAFATTDALAEQAVSLALLGATHLALGNAPRAQQATAQAVALLGAGHESTEFPPQEIWWWHYRALNATGDAAAWEALQRTYQALTATVATLSDAGLRRNFLNKVPINRDICETWMHEATSRGFAPPPDALATVAGRLATFQDQLGRMLTISSGMNERRDVAGLREFVLDELVELSGAERAFLLLHGQGPGEGDQLVTRGIDPEAHSGLLEWAAPMLHEAAQTRQPVLRHDVPDLLTTAAAPPAMRLRSVLAVPLLRGTRIIGTLYADLRLLSGRFAQVDQELLTLLAAQAATALENARLYAQTLRANAELEQRVAERTAALEQRAAELSALAEVSRDVSATLDLPVVLERIAGHAKRLLAADTSAVLLPDPDGQTFRAITVLGADADAIRNDSFALGAGIIGGVALRGTPEMVADSSTDPRTHHIPGTDATSREQLMVAPLLARERVIGVMAIWRVQLDPPFSEVDLSFLTGLARQAAIAITNARLFEDAQQARLAAETANIAKSTFLANMSHELRTPLNAVLGFSQVMERDLDVTVRQREHLTIIARSGEHLLGLINDVLEMSKIESGRVTLNAEPFDLLALLGGVEELFRLRAEAKGLHLLLDADASLPQFVLGDESKLRQIMINLLGNALKFTHEGGVTLRAAYRSGERPLLVFEVDDTGEGIAPEQLPQLFQAFAQTASGIRAQEGTGLGLAICRQFARLMDGDITVASRLGQGSTFRVEVLLPPAAASGVRQAPVVRRVVSIDPADTREYRVLVVDDKWENRRLLVEWLGRAGFLVREAANGLEALDCWESWEPQLIWMDVRMPVMDGYEATRQIKATIKGQATIVIALTASVFEHEQAVVRATGCDDVVYKPVREATVFEKVGQHLGVRFVYDTPPAEPQQEGEAVTGAALATLPADMLRALQQAAEEYDPAMATAVAQQIGTIDRQLGDALLALVAEFRFDAIEGLIQQSRAKEAA